MRNLIIIAAISFLPFVAMAAVSNPADCAIPFQCTCPEQPSQNKCGNGDPKFGINPDWTEAKGGYEKCEKHGLWTVCVWRIEKTEWYKNHMRTIARLLMAEGSQSKFPQFAEWYR